MPTADYILLASGMALDAQIDPALVLAVVEQESGGRTFVTRYEPGYRYLVNPSEWAVRRAVTSITEELGQKTSWGLMQIMGATARELGFCGYFPELCNPELGIYYGCLYLKKQISKWEELDDAIAAYNAGSPRRIGAKYENQRYVDSVKNKWEKFKLITIRGTK